jgi:hypothetical protein
MSLTTLLQSGKTRLLARVRDTAGTAERFGRMERRVDQILDQLKMLNERIDDAARREAQLRAIVTRDIELEPQMAKLEHVLRDAEASGHVASVVDRAVLHAHPFPYAVVDDALPRELYWSLIRGLPPLELFSDRAVNKQQLTVPLRLAPAYSRRVWQFLTDVAIPKLVTPAVIEKFRGPLDDWIALNWPDVPPAAVELHSSDGRILLRRRGYRIPPHRDPKWAFLTGILYLARREDNEAWGTRLYTVDNDAEAPGASPHWIDPDRCRFVREVAFKPNRMLIFLNSVGAHGAEIPADAEPASLERYIYQFRIAPTVESMGRLKATLPEERRPLWAGKAADD